MTATCVGCGATTDDTFRDHWMPEFFSINRAPCRRYRCPPCDKRWLSTAPFRPKMNLYSTPWRTPEEIEEGYAVARGERRKMQREEAACRRSRDRK